ncbi:glycosyltransferase [Acetivibrio saccincola]|jgi:tetratricopeptide (TPR) repeat protein|uniref:Glycosyl transferase family 2 n=1 Tax=Acetivibrio saccincola TaxID=1677857 RepID=A0A2K9E8I5_9FIRM|nr:glycosyltransferase [Acetivibrio saccincola]AUG57886.1 Glycosyl transferase family 2 [Acetivibrio saccincola]NLW27507.1 glycosyltransferase [Acetivibrio saccincola]PQQ67783.1 hypothetical protein B9R14_14180 [Acetivibrio saccincola]HQD28369.1 glycosyltransferase [Acetivibrio saccincola]
MNEMFLSVCIVVREVRSCILKCIDSVKDIADEIIILNTCPYREIPDEIKNMDIPKDVKISVYKAKWNNSYGEAKNFCLDKTKGRWVLFINPYEELEKVNKEKLHELLRDPNVEGYFLHIDNTGKILPLTELIRLFRNRREYRYKHRVFERITDKGLHFVKDSGIKINSKNSIRKDENYLLELELNENPNDGYIQYVYGIDLMNKKLYKESSKFFRKSEKNTNPEEIFAPHLYRCFILSLVNLKEEREAFKILEKGMELFPFYKNFLNIEIIMNVMNIFLEKREYEEALECTKHFEKYKNLENQINSIKFICYTMLKKEEEALKILDLINKDSVYYNYMLLQRVESLWAGERWEEAKSLLISVKKTDDNLISLYNLIHEVLTGKKTGNITLSHSQYQIVNMIKDDLLWLESEDKAKILTDNFNKGE